LRSEPGNLFLLGSPKWKDSGEREDGGGLDDITVNFLLVKADGISVGFCY
jgi:hypothetical protein